MLLDVMLPGTRVMLPEIQDRVARNSWSCRQKFPYTLDKISGGMAPVSGNMTYERLDRLPFQWLPCVDHQHSSTRRIVEHADDVAGIACFCWLFYNLFSLL